MVKGDAYGHGLLEMARCLEESRQVDLLVAGTVNEGIRLCAAGVALPILLLPPLDSRLAAGGAGAYSVLDALLDYNLTASVYTVGFARELHLRSREHGTKAEVHIRIDTNRGGYGVPAAQFPAVLRELGELEGLQINGVYTHLYDSYAACPEEERRQLELFDSALAGVPPEQPKRQKIKRSILQDPWVMLSFSFHRCRGYLIRISRIQTPEKKIMPRLYLIGEIF